MLGRMHHAADPIVNRAVGSALFWLGMGLGSLVGAAFAIMRRAWRDYKTVKNSVPNMRKAAWGHTGGFLKFGLLLVGAIFISLLWLTGYHANDQTTPATVPTVPASPASPSPHR
jgi:hypothetical protein